MAGVTKKVVDASVILSRFLPDEKPDKKVTELFVSFQENKVDFIAPTLLQFEVGNALRTAVRRKRIKQSLAEEMYVTFLSLPIIYTDIDYYRALRLSLEKNLSFYDASYICLAREEKVDLVSLDKRLASAS